jgi:hypothetical protein
LPFYFKNLPEVHQIEGKFYKFKRSFNFSNRSCFGKILVKTEKEKEKTIQKKKETGQGEPLWSAAGSGPRPVSLLFQIGTLSPPCFADRRAPPVILARETETNTAGTPGRSPPPL